MCTRRRRRRRRRRGLKGQQQRTRQRSERGEWSVGTDRRVFCSPFRPDHPPIPRCCTFLHSSSSSSPLPSSHHPSGQPRHTLPHRFTTRLPPIYLPTCIHTLCSRWKTCLSLHLLSTPTRRGLHLLESKPDMYLSRYRAACF